MPMARVPVTMAANASGTAATARAMANITTVMINGKSTLPPIDSLRILIAATRKHMEIAVMPSHFPISSVLFSSGVFSVSAAAHLLGNLAEFRVHPRGGDNCLAPAVGDRGPGKDHIPSITDAYVLTQWLQYLPYGHGFSREGCLIASEGMSFQSIGHRTESYLLLPGAIYHRARSL